MSRTLLYTVQRVLEKLDLDAVNSINDSQDAILIAREAEDTFYDLVSRNEWPQRYDIINVESVGDTSNPTALRMPDNVLNIKTFRYDVAGPDDDGAVVKELTKLTPDEFLDIIYARDPGADNIVSAEYKGITLYVYNDQAPLYFTSFDNQYIILDSWYVSEETTVQGVNAVVYASSVPTFEFDDDYIIPVDMNTFPLYLAELTAASSFSLNGTQSPEEERRRNRGISRLRDAAYRTEHNLKSNKFGRNGNGRS